MKIENYDTMHTPVLIKEVLEYLNIEPGDRIIDATINGGGHARAILEKFEDVKILGIEYDPKIFKNLEIKDSRLIAVNDSYVNLKKIVEEYDFQPDGILFDLGLSSWHYEKSGRGFSFLRDEYLDMRFNPESGEPDASQIINTSSKEELERIFREYGEERFSKQIANAIVRARKSKLIAKTSDLVEVIGQTVPKWYKRRKIHFATKTFQALRIAVNHELENVERGVKEAIDALKPGGRIVVISFQGLEDKIVKNIFREKAKAGIVRFIIKGTIKPSWEEKKNNPRARSAKMKVAEKV